MLSELELPNVTELPPQRAFLRALVPNLAALKQIAAIMLTGSLARGDADRWSSVDLNLLWQESAPGSPMVESPHSALRNSLDKALGANNRYFAQCQMSDFGGSLTGICLDAPGSDEFADQRRAAGVKFEISWVTSSNAGETVNRNVPVHYLYVAEHLSDDLQRKFPAQRAALYPPDSSEVDSQLGQFWLLLARLPAVLNRQERLAAHALLTELRTLMIDLVVCLNGASRPRARARINQYLGEAQREAFERSLGSSQPILRNASEGSTNWMGQAVALVVLYRWYAPQLAEQHDLSYPQSVEDTVLALLHAEIEGWPAYIATD